MRVLTAPSIVCPFLLQFKWREAQEEALGLWHPDTADTYHSMATVFQDFATTAKKQSQKRSFLDSALVYFQRALEIREDAFGEESREAGDTSKLVALVYQARCEWHAAAAHFRNAATAFAAVLGREHPETVVASKFSAQCYYRAEVGLIMLLTSN